MDIQIISGFLGAGKTTFLNKYLPLLPGNTVVIENEFGQIGLDGQLIQDDIPVRELRAGCICCTLALGFRNSIKELAEKYQPDHILIEPSGVAMLEDVVAACQGARDEEGVQLDIGKRITIVDAASFDAFVDNFPFYLEQVENAGLILLSHLNELPEGQSADDVAALIRQHNADAVIYADDWRELDGDVLLSLVEASPDRPAAETEHQEHADADEVFGHFSVLKPPLLQEETPERVLAQLKSGDYGKVLRAKGFLTGSGGKRYYVDLTMSSAEWRPTEDENSRGLVVIGCDLDKQALKKLFTGR